MPTTDRIWLFTVPGKIYRLAIKIDWTERSIQYFDVVGSAQAFPPKKRVLDVRWSTRMTESTLTGNRTSCAGRNT